MIPTTDFRPLLLAAVLILASCSDDSPENLDPSAAYQAFFEDLAEGHTDKALEELAPEGALGSTFQSAGYYMLAKEFDDRMKEHGEVQRIIIDREQPLSEHEIMVEGRIRFEDGSEISRNIRFTREQDRWVGRI